MGMRSRGWVAGNSGTSSRFPVAALMAMSWITSTSGISCSNPSVILLLQSGHDQLADGAQGGKDAHALNGRRLKAGQRAPVQIAFQHGGGKRVRQVTLVP